MTKVNQSQVTEVPYKYNVGQETRIVAKIQGKLETKLGELGFPEKLDMTSAG